MSQGKTPYPRNVQRTFPRKKLICESSPRPMSYRPDCRSGSSVSLKFGRKEINQENYVKFPGVPLDSALSWKYHLAALAKNWPEHLVSFLKAGI